MKSAFSVQWYNLPFLLTFLHILDRLGIYIVNFNNDVKVLLW